MRSHFLLCCSVPNRKHPDCSERMQKNGRCDNSLLTKGRSSIEIQSANEKEVTLSGNHVKGGGSYESPSSIHGACCWALCRSFHRKIIADIICRSCCVNSCFFLVINPSVQYESKWVSERSIWMLRSDALLRYSFFYRGNSDYRLPEFQRLFLQHCTPFD